MWSSDDLGHSRAYGYSFEIGHGGYVAAIPLGSSSGHFNSEKQPDIEVMQDALLGIPCVGREYFLTVKAKDLDTVLITAKLRFTQLRDRLSFEKVDNINDYLANYIGDFEVELISYEYSYVYDMMQ